MCMFAGEVESVGDTKIFAATHGGRQFTAYVMQFQMPRLTRAMVESGTNPPGNAMILPVPWLPGEDIELVDLSKAEDFFTKLKELVPETRFRSRGGRMSKSATLGFGDDHLEVFKVGKFDVSIAKTTADIDRANPDVFSMGANTRAAVEAHYSSGYAFIICALAESGGIHPLGYISGARENIFVPTRHEHGDGFDLPKWDHDIYVASAAPAPLRNPADAPIRSHRTEGIQPGHHTYNQVWGDLKARVPGLAAFEGPLVRYRYKGRFKNIDFQVPRG